MKILLFKRVFMILILAFLLFGCGVYGTHDNIVVNKSDFDVRFSLRQSGTYMIRAGQILTIRNQVGAVINAYESSPANRVKFVQTDTREGEFVNLPSIEVRFVNNLDIQVFVSAGGYMVNEPLLVPANSNDVYDRIFTREQLRAPLEEDHKPSFLVETGGIPATYEVSILRPGNEYVLVVTIG